MKHGSDIPTCEYQSEHTFGGRFISLSFCLCYTALEDARWPLNQPSADIRIGQTSFLGLSPCNPSNAFLGEDFSVTDNVAEQDCHFRGESRAINALNRLHAELRPRFPM
ncbi:hypothetical protein LOAG_15301 [Loa loa]|nr:hypothetical protein LOAG_15301 [Loa loa]EFO13228.2 hypothetical protein LOAG_15301 [Loa loa]